MDTNRILIIIVAVIVVLTLAGCGDETIQAALNACQSQSTLNSAQIAQDSAQAKKDKETITNDTNRIENLETLQRIMYVQAMALLENERFNAGIAYGCHILIDICPAAWEPAYKKSLIFYGQTFPILPNPWPVAGIMMIKLIVVLLGIFVVLTIYYTVRIFRVRLLKPAIIDLMEARQIIETAAESKAAVDAYVMQIRAEALAVVDTLTTRKLRLEADIQSDNERFGTIRKELVEIEKLKTSLEDQTEQAREILKAVQSGGKKK